VVSDYGLRRQDFVGVHRVQTQHSEQLQFVSLVTHTFLLLCDRATLTAATVLLSQLIAAAARNFVTFTRLCTFTYHANTMLFALRADACRRNVAH